MKGKAACHWATSPCWLRSLRDFLIPLAATWTLVAIFGLILGAGARVLPLDIFLILILTLLTILLTVGLIAIWRRCVYLSVDFVEWLNVQRGHVTRSEKQKIDARLGKLYIKALFDRPSRDYRRLAGLHTDEKIAQLLVEFPGITYIDIPRNASHPGKYFLDYCARFMHRTSHVDLYWLAPLERMNGATIRLHSDHGQVRVKALSPNAELDQVIQQAKDKLTIEGSLLEVTVKPSWLRVRVIGGTWLGRVFGERIAEGIAFTESLVAQLGQRYTPLPPDRWMLNDNLEVVPVAR